MSITLTDMPVPVAYQTRHPVMIRQYTDWCERMDRWERDWEYFAARHNPHSEAVTKGFRTAPIVVGLRMFDGFSAPQGWCELRDYPSVVAPNRNTRIGRKVIKEFVGNQVGPRLELLGMPAEARGPVDERSGAQPVCVPRMALLADDEILVASWKYPPVEVDAARWQKVAG